MCTYNEENLNLKQHKMVLNSYNIFQILILGFGSVALLWLSYLHLCNHVRYVTFNTNLNLHCKNKTIKSPQSIWTFLSVIMFVFLLSQCEKDQILFFIIHTNSNFGSVIDLALKFSKIILWTIFGTIIIYIFSVADTPAAWILCLMVFQMWCHSCTKTVPHWLPYILIYCLMIFN